MREENIQIDEDEIDLKELFRTIYRYRYMIISLSMVLTLASGFYAYFKPNVYKASAMVEVGLEKSKFSSEDMLAMAMDTGSLNAETEMGVIQSRFLSEKALKEVDLAHHYYTTRRYKELELYKESPFRVGMKSGYGISFDLIPLDEKRYRLIVEEAEDKDGNVWNYNKIHRYEREVVTQRFHLNVLKTKKPQDEVYRFVVDDPQKIAVEVKKRVNVSQDSKASSLLTISFEDNVALRAQEFTNALTSAYLAQSVEKKTREASRKLAFIDNQLKLITENLKGSAVKIEEFKTSSNMVNLSSKAQNIIVQMSDYETKLAEISIQQEMLETLYTEVKKGQNLESLSVAGLELGGSSLQEMTKQLQDAILQKKILREDYTEMYPGVRKLQKTIVQVKGLIVTTIQSLSKSIKERKALLEQSTQKLQKELNTLPADERMFGQLQRKFAVNEKIYSYLLEKRSETEIMKASTVSKNRVIDEALLPEDPIKPKRKLIVVVGLILGLILGIALAFLREFLDDRIKSEDDVSKGTKVPVLGIVPNIKDDSDKVKVFLSPKSAIAESFRNLRTNLQFMVDHKQAHVIAVTSTVGAEGKTTVCINLGGIMSMAERKTVILNLDMRKPTLHEKFDLKNSKGMSTLLSGRSTLKEVIQPTKYPNLDIITSGPVPPNPSELIQNTSLEKILAELKEQYDAIILDTPPIGLVTDARTLMHLADTSIYVLRANHSKKGFLRSVEKLSQEDIRGFGILINDARMDYHGYGYGYGYYEEDRH